MCPVGLKNNVTKKVHLMDIEREWGGGSGGGGGSHRDREGQRQREREI